MLIGITQKLRWQLVIYSTAFIICGAFAQPSQIIGTGTSYSYNYGPIYRASSTSTYNYSNYVYLYLSSELEIPSGSIITGISWEKQNTYTLTGSNFLEIKLENTTQTSIAVSSNNYNTETATSTTAFSTNSYSIPATTGWHDHILDTPFEYTGDNLKIGVGHQKSGTASGAIYYYYETQTGLAAGIRGTSSTSGTTFSTTYSNRRPNIRIYYIPPLDAGVSRLSEPVDVAFPSVSTPIKAIIKNYGLDNITSADVSYSLNGAPAVSASWTGDLAPDEESAPVYIGDGTFTSGSNTLNVWTSNVNGTTDDYSGNDTLYTTIDGCADIITEGTYTVGSTPGNDYATIADAVADLYVCGINGPVVFLLDGQTFTERIVLTDIPGSSPDNTVTFRGTIGTEIDYVATSSGYRSSIYVNGAKHLRFENIKITAMGASTYFYGWGVLIGSNSKDIIVRNCDITVYSSSSTNNCGIVISGSTTSPTSAASNVSEIVLENNTINGGYYGIVFSGTDGDNITDSRIVGNKVTNVHYYGLYTLYCSNILIANNAIGGGFRNTTTYGIYMNGTVDADIFYNSVNCDVGAGRAIYTSSNSTGLDVRNNTFVHLGTGTSSYSAYFATSYTDFVELNYNNYHCPNASYLAYHGGNRTTLAAWQTANPTLNANSISGDPEYLSATNLLPDVDGTQFLMNKGTPLDDVTNDIRSVARDETTPDIGAYEFKPQALDAGISEITSPVDVALTTEPVPVRATIKNLGTDDLTSVDVYYSVNGDAPVSASWTGDLAQDEEEVNFYIGTANFNVGSNIIKVWTSSPNGGFDANQSNDTLVSIIEGCPSIMSGTYTVGSTPGNDYATIADAVADLYVCGINGPVVFLLDGEVFNERIEITDVLGTSSLNTITFRGQTGTEIQYTGASGTRASVFVNSAKHIRFENVSITPSGSYGWGVHIFSNSQDIHVRNCVINIINNSTSTNYSGIVISGSTTSATTGADNVRDIVIENNTISGGYYGISAYGLDANRIADLKIIGNSISDCYYYGIYKYYTARPEILDNTIETRSAGTTTTSAVNIYSLYTDGPFQIKANILTNPGRYCLYMNGAVSTPESPSTIANNSIGGGFRYTSSTCYGIYLTASSSIDILYNSVNFDGPQTTTGGGAIRTASTATGLDIRNNTFVNSGTSTAYVAYIQTSVANLNAMDYNNYFSNGSGFVYYNGSHRTTLAILQTQGATYGHNQHSISGNPAYTSSTYLYPDTTVSTILRYGATPIESITTDIVGVTRNPVTPDIGAYEHQSLGNDAGISEITEPSGVASSSAPVPVYAKIKNFATDNLTSADILFSVNGGLPTTFPWTGDLEQYNEDGPVYIGDASFLDGPNTLTVWTSDPNGSSDQNTFNDTLEVEIYGCQDLPIPTADPASIYCGTTATLTATGSPAEYAWFADTNMTIELATGATFVTVELVSDTFFFVASTSDEGICASSTRKVQITVNELPAPATSPAFIDCGETATLTASGSPAGYTWFADEAGTEIIGNDATLVTPRLNSFTSYWVASSNDLCYSDLIRVDVSVDTYIAPPIVSDGLIFCGDTAIITASGSTGEFTWFTDPLGVDVLESGASLVLSDLSSDTTVYIAASSPWGEHEVTFTPCGATGRLGPNQTAVDAAYSGIVHLDGNVTVLGDGIQEWIVPYTGTYKIEAYGAQGGNPDSEDNYGAVMSGEFELKRGQKIHILVGQQGSYHYHAPLNTFGSGGGGTFVVEKGATNEDGILIIAGGGGGYAPIRDTSPLAGKTVPDGSDGSGYVTGFPGGADGGGGGGSGASTTWRAGGGGFYGNGQGGGVFPEIGGGGMSFLNGGAGGTGYVPGGFGGGGGVTIHTTSDSRSAGGAGGYSGGGAASSHGGSVYDGQGASGGGGGSFNNGINQINTAGVNPGHGKVVITFEGIAPLCHSEILPVNITVNQLPPPSVADTTIDCGQPLILTAECPMSIAEDFIWFYDIDGMNIIDRGASLETDPLSEDTVFYVAATSEWIQVDTVIFTNCSATGNIGPDQSAVDATYSGDPFLDGKVTVLGDGIQEWEVPYTGTYTIEAYGAQGGNANWDNLGAKMSGEFELTKGEKIHILVGQKGEYFYSSYTLNCASGGGGSFVVKAGATDESDILLIAAGAGGYCPSQVLSPLTGKIVENASNGIGYTDSYDGGIDGNGGLGGGGSVQWQAGGGGFFTDGTAGGSLTGGGKAFINGGTGGYSALAPGGFGGGGSANSTGANRRAGGGGGFSGGGAANSASSGTGSTDGSSGGGGGSLNNGSNQVNEEGVNIGDGKVLIIFNGTEPTLCMSEIVTVNVTVENTIPDPTILTPNPTITACSNTTLEVEGSTGDYIWFDSEHNIIGRGATFETPILTETTTYYVSASTEWTDEILTFTNCGATGRFGPTAPQMNLHYGTELAGQIDLIGDGIQEWTVPYPGTYRITAYGAQGGTEDVIGKGAKMSGNFAFEGGEKIHILVGQEGGYRRYLDNRRFASGGGGSFVVLEGASDECDILLIAGGGGGHLPISTEDPIDADMLPSGKDGWGAAGSGTGGTDGNGGTASSTGNSGAGGGFLTDGGTSHARDGKSFLNGGTGGEGGYDSVHGGFGGGGGTSYVTSSDVRYTGAGGGYSGGGSAHTTGSNTTGASSGGGGSYNNGIDQDNEAGYNEGHGRVVIEFGVPPLCSSRKLPIEITVNPLPSPSVDDVTISCTESVILTASGSPDSYIWFADEAGTIEIGTGAEFSTGPLVADTTVYVVSSAQDGLCISTPPVEVTVFVNPLEDPIIIGETEICCGQSVDLTASGSSGEFIWFADASATTEIGTSAEFASDALTNDTTFYVQAIQDAGLSDTYSFNNCGATGRLGPSQIQADAAYTATSLEGEITILGDGIQEWTVPYSGTYRIEAYGAQGGGNSISYSGGKGAKMTGEFFLTAGQRLNVLVGQEGGYNTNGGGGGGGSFVVKEEATDESGVLLIAGGGGGNYNTTNYHILDGNITTSGTDGERSTGVYAGGIDGNGGQSQQNTAGGGGGFLTDGWDDASGRIGLSFLNGGVGGNQLGGFGGGGGANTTSAGRNGGGGGYSGGGAGFKGNGVSSAAGGGGSYNNGVDQDNESGVREGHGLVVITGPYIHCTSELLPVSITVHKPPTDDLSDGDYIWSGNTNTDWGSAANWLIYSGAQFTIAESQPTSSDNVFILTFDDGPCPANDPTLTESGSFDCKSLSISAGRTLTSETSLLNIYGDWKSEGSFVPNDGTVKFTGNGVSSIYTPEIFFDLKIDKTEWGYFKLESNIAVTGELDLSATRAEDGTCGGVMLGSYEIDLD